MTDLRNKLSNSRLLYIYKVGNIALSLICALICAMGTLFFYDYNPGYFKAGAVTVILYIAIAVSIIFAVSATILPKRDFKLSSPTSRASLPIISIIPACAFVYYAISLTPSAFAGSGNSKPYILQIVFAILAFLYFFISAIEISDNKNIIAISGLASLVSPILIAVNSYFDYTEVMNGPEKLFMQFATVLFALFIVNEVRFALDKSYPRFYVCIASLSSVFCTTSAANKICILSKNTHLASNESLSLAALLLCLGIYSALRLIFVKQDTTDTDAADTNPVNESAEEISEESTAESAENIPLESDESSPVETNSENTPDTASEKSTASDSQ